MKLEIALVVLLVVLLLAAAVLALYASRLSWLAELLPFRRIG